MLVYVTREPDQGGEALVEQVGRHLPEALVAEMPPETKDWNNLWLQADRDVEAFLARVRELLSQARPVRELAQEAEREEAKSLLGEVRDFLLRPDIFSELVRLTEELGHAGDAENAAALHLALATAKFAPAPVLIKGPASSGKSHLLETALQLWPPEAYIFRSGASERWLAYTDEDFRHRFIVLAEARALETEFGAYLARTLISEGRLVYETVEKTPPRAPGPAHREGGAHGPHRHYHRLRVGQRVGVPLLDDRKPGGRAILGPGRPGHRQAPQRGPGRAGGGGGGPEGAAMALPVR